MWPCVAVDQVSSRRYGRPWRNGEVLGVFLDLDAGVLSFSLSGEFFGPCFEGLPRGKDHTYFPAVSFRCVCVCVCVCVSVCVSVCVCVCVH
jgi:hypothetical protein